MLERVVYCGKVTWNGEVVAGQHEPLVSARTFRAVQERLAMNGSLAPRQRLHSWSPLYRCGVCGSAMSAANATGSQGDVWRYFRCAARFRLPAEQRHEPLTVSQARANRYLWEAVVAQIEEGTLQRWVETSRRRARSAEHREREAEVRLRLKELERQIGYNLRAASEEAVDLVVLRATNAPLLAEQERLRGELSGLDTDRSEATDASRLLRAIPAHLQALTEVQRRDLLLRLLARVDVHSSRKLTAHWSLPGADPLIIALPARVPRA